MSLTSNQQNHPFGLKVGYVQTYQYNRLDSAIKNLASVFTLHHPHDIVKCLGISFNYFFVCFFVLKIVVKRYIKLLM